MTEDAVAVSALVSLAGWLKQERSPRWTMPKTASVCRTERPDQVVGGPETKNELAALKAFVNSASTRRDPVCTVEHSRAAVFTCLVGRASVDAGAAVMTDQVA